jgi:hypothetical protein
MERAKFLDLSHSMKLLEPQAMHGMHWHGVGPPAGADTFKVRTTVVKL